MGFNRRKMEDQRRAAAAKEAASRRATDAQLLEDAERLIAGPYHPQGRPHRRFLRSKTSESSVRDDFAKARKRHRPTLTKSMSVTPIMGLTLLAKPT